jgi:hypothetical protein
MWTYVFVWVWICVFFECICCIVPASAVETTLSSHNRHVRLFLEGASWDRPNRRLKESAPKELLRELPLIHVTAAQSTKPRGRVFKCPVYVYPNRTDINWVFDVDLPTDDDPDHWVIRGAACLLATE